MADGDAGAVGSVEPDEEPGWLPTPAEVSAVPGSSVPEAEVSPGFSSSAALISGLTRLFAAETSARNHR